MISTSQTILPNGNINLVTTKMGEDGSVYQKTAILNQDLETIKETPFKALYKTKKTGVMASSYAGTVPAEPPSGKTNRWSPDLEAEFLVALSEEVSTNMDGAVNDIGSFLEKVGQKLSFKRTGRALLFKLAKSPALIDSELVNNEQKQPLLVSDGSQTLYQYLVSQAANLAK